MSNEIGASCDKFLTSTKFVRYSEWWLISLVFVVCRTWTSPRIPHATLYPIIYKCVRQILQSGNNNIFEMHSMRRPRHTVEQCHSRRINSKYHIYASVCAQHRTQAPDATNSMRPHCTQFVLGLGTLSRFRIAVDRSRSLFGHKAKAQNRCKLLCSIQMIQGNIKAIGLNFRGFDSTRILLLLQSITYSLSLWCLLRTQNAPHKCQLLPAIICNHK